MNIFAASKKILIVTSIILFLIILLQFESFSSLEDNVKIRSIVSSLWAFVGLVIIGLIVLGKRFNLRRLLCTPYILTALGAIGTLWYFLTIIGRFGNDVSEVLPISKEMLYGATALVVLLLLVIVVGIWRDKFWGYLIALVVNLIIFLGSTIYHVNKVFCGKENCVPAEETTYLANSVAAVLFVISIFLFYFLRKRTVGLEKAARQTKIVSFLMVAALFFILGIPTLQAYSQEAKGVQGAKAEIERISKLINPLHPTYLPPDWDFLWEAAYSHFGEELETHYIPKKYRGSWSYALIIEQKLNPNEDKEYFQKNLVGGERLTIQGYPALYTGIGHQLWWNYDNLTIIFRCTDSCFSILTKEDILDIANSMER